MAISIRNPFREESEQVKREEIQKRVGIKIVNPFGSSEEGRMVGEQRQTQIQPSGRVVIGGGFEETPLELAEPLTQGTFKTSTPAASVQSPFIERGVVDQIFSKEVLGPKALFEGIKGVGETAVRYPRETTQAVIAGIYSGAIEPVLEAGISFNPIIPKGVKTRTIDTLRRATEIAEEKIGKMPKNVSEIYKGFEFSSIVAPYNVGEALVDKFLPRLPGLLARGISWVGVGQILHKPEEGNRALRAATDIGLLGVGEIIGLGLRPLFRALTPKTQGTLANLMADEKITITDAEKAASEITGRIEAEYQNNLGRIQELEQKTSLSQKDKVVLQELKKQTEKAQGLKQMMDDMRKGRDLVAEEEQKVALSSIEEYNKKFPNKKFPLEDLPGASRRLENLEAIAQSKITRLQKIRDFLSRPLIEEDSQDLRELIGDLRKEIAEAVPKVTIRKPNEAPFIATDAEIEGTLSSIVTMERQELKETILNLEAKLAMIQSGKLVPSAQEVTQIVGGLTKKEVRDILERTGRLQNPLLQVKDKIVKIEKEIIKVNNEVADKRRLLEGILNAGEIAEKRIKQKFPQMYDYQNYLRSQIEPQENILKISKDAADWKPKTIGYDNPYTKRAYNLWDKVIDLWRTKVPRFFKISASKEVEILARERQRIIDALTSKSKDEILKLVERLPFEERATVGLMINKYIEVPASYTSLIKDIDLALGKLGNSIVELNKQWSKDGLFAPFLTEETWLQHLGSYSRSFYGKERLPGQFTTVPPAGPVKAFINRSQFRKKLTLKEWGEYALRFEGKTEEEILKFNPKELDQLGLKAKKEYGWIYEADAVLERTFKDSINNYATMLWQDAIVRDPNLFSKVEAPGFIPIKSLLPRSIERDIRLGPLNDGWVHPGLTDELGLFIREPREFASIVFGEALNWFKISKTAMGPAVFRNYVSGGLVQTDMAGAPLWMPKNAKTYFDSIRDYWSKGNRYEFWRDRGLYGADYFSVEISDDMWKLINESKNPYSELALQLERKSQKAKDLFKYYGMIDHSHRTYLAEFAVKNGATPEQAVHFANKWELDYRIVPQFLEKARRGIGGYLFPFVSFYTLMAPRILEVLITRPWVLLKYPIIASAMGYVATQKLGLTTEQVETGKPEFLKDQPYVVPMPWLDEEGNIQYLNLSYTLPFGSWETGFVDWRQYLDLAKSEGLFGVVRGIIENRDPFTEQPIWTQADEKLGEKGNKILTYVLRGFGPAALPHIMNLYAAATGEVIGFPFQRRRSLSQSMLRAVGLSTYSGGYNEAFWKIEELEHQSNQINLALEKTMTSTTITEREKDRVFNETTEALDEINNQISEITRNLPPLPNTRPRPEQQQKGRIQIINPLRQNQ